jgi:probable rRNA maturation factor
MSRMPEGDQGAGRLRVRISDERGRRVRVDGLGRWLARIAPAGARGVVCVALVSDGRVRALNRSYRRKDYATDVLSFPAFARTGNGRASTRQASPQPPRLRSSAINRATAGPSDQPSPAPFLGDIVIARGVARRQARAMGHAEATELRILALHGLLHLLGYDHEGDHGRMQRLERRLRRKGGLREGLIERAQDSRVRPRAPR